MRDPYARLARRQRWQARLRRLGRALAAPSLPRQAPAHAGPPHLLLVGVDTLRAGHLGCYGYTRPTSPALNRLAGAGTLFTDVMAPAPWTLPSFAGALTGLLPGLHGGFLGGAVRNMDRQVPGRLRPDVVTLAAHLRGLGYRTAAFYANQFFAFGLAESFGTHAYHNLPADDLLAMAGDWLVRHADRPCFCFVLLNDPHEPTTPPVAELAAFLPTPAPATAALAEMARWGGVTLPHLGRASDPTSQVVRDALALKLAVYDATVRQVDDALARLQARLETTGLAARTLVTVFADHGEEFLDHAEAAARWDHDPRGLRGIGHGQSHFQELLHVPWLAWGPGVPRGARRTEPASLLDLAPTVLDWLDLPPLPLPPAPSTLPPAVAAALTGRSLARPDGGGERLLLAEAIAYGPDLVALRQGPWKLIAARDGRPLALFDLAADPREQRDLAPARPDIVAMLREAAVAWQASGKGAHDSAGGGEWSELDGTVRERLRDLGYSE